MTHLYVRLPQQLAGVVYSMEYERKVVQTEGLLIIIALQELL